jgi:hypothetical protein
MHCSVTDPADQRVITPARHREHVEGATFAGLVRRLIREKWSRWAPHKLAARRAGIVAVVVAGQSYEIPAVKAIVAGYAFDDVEFTVHAAPGVPEALSLTRPQWAYRTYDCIPPSGGSEFSDLDLLVVDGLNAQLDASQLGAMQAIRPQLGEAIAALDGAETTTPGSTTFWLLDPEHVRTAPPFGTPGWWIWRAWALLMGTAGIGITVTHKVLHHKRPSMFPLIDRLTAPILGETQIWASIHDELNAKPDEWTELERWFAETADARGTARLTRLRLHDIVAWTRASGNQGRWVA